MDGQINKNRVIQLCVRARANGRAGGQASERVCVYHLSTLCESIKHRSVFNPLSVDDARFFFFVRKQFERFRATPRTLPSPRCVPFPMINCVRELFARISLIRLLWCDDENEEITGARNEHGISCSCMFCPLCAECDIVKFTRTANSSVCYSSLACDDRAAWFLHTQTWNDMSNAAKPNRSFGKCVCEIEIRTLATWARARAAQRNNRKNSHCPYDPHALPSDCSWNDQSERKSNVTQHATEHGRTARFKTKENRSHRRACKWWNRLEFEWMNFNVTPPFPSHEVCHGSSVVRHVHRSSFIINRWCWRRATSHCSMGRPKQHYRAYAHGQKYKIKMNCVCILFLFLF